MVNSSIISENSIAGFHIDLMRFDFNETSRHSKFPTAADDSDLTLSGLFRHRISREDANRASVEFPRRERQIGVHDDREFIHVFAPGDVHPTAVSDLLRIFLRPDGERIIHSEQAPESYRRINAAGEIGVCDSDGARVSATEDIMEIEEDTCHFLFF